MEMMGDDWVLAWHTAAEADPEGKVLFPLVKNLYGKSDSGTNFIEDFQRSLTGFHSNFTDHLK